MIYRNIFLLLPLAAISAVCQQTPGGLSAEEMTSLRAEYGKLNEQTFKLKGNPQMGRILDEAPERVPVVRKELLDVLRRGITQAFSSPRPTDGQIRDAISGVQGDFALSAGWGNGWDGTNTPFADLFSLNGDQCLAAAYAIMEGGEGIPDSQSFLDFYVKRSNESKLQAVTGSEFRSSTFFVSSIPAGLAGESWFLAWGVHIGNTRGKLSIRLYAFDGDKVRVVWKRDELPYGQVEISGSIVTLDYVKDLDRDVARTHEVLHIAPDGLR